MQNTSESDFYWAECASGNLYIKHCNSCGENHFYPRDICPHCFSEATEWLKSEGKGSIYSFSRQYKDEKEHIVAYVTLDEGVTVMTNLLPHQDIHIGKRVSVSFKEIMGRQIPVFEVD